jgi:PHD/YefM family antitoxin component YafN of YafNO toxin-antitoxin module
MNVISPAEIKNELDIIIGGIEDSYEPTIISGKTKSAVLLSQDLWDSIEETLYLYSIPGVKESILSAKNEPIENASDTLEWE